jgi:hypothetical protein
MHAFIWFYNLLQCAFLFSYVCLMNFSLYVMSVNNKKKIAIILLYTLQQLFIGQTYFLNHNYIFN